MSLLVADCVSKRFDRRMVLSAGTLRAVPGEVRVLLGRNGAGKSTLLRIAAGWVVPDSGTVRFDGVAYESARLPRLATLGLFYLPDHDLLSESYTVRQQLELFRRRFNGGDCEDAAAQMGISGVLDQKPHTLSGGERRRAELAVVLVRRPRCLLADEPYRGVTPIDTDALTRAYQALAHDGCAIVVTGHEAPVLLAAADHVTWCTAGTTYELGSPDTAKTHERFRRDYLGMRP